MSQAQATNAYPPVSETAIAARQTPKTLHTVAQLAQEYTTIQRLLKRRSKSPSSPTEQALKRCQMAMHNTTFLDSKIKDLRAISVRQKRKRETPHSYIANGGVFDYGGKTRSSQKSSSSW